MRDIKEDDKSYKQVDNIGDRRNLDFDEIKTSIRDYLRANTNFTDYDFEGSNDVNLRRFYESFGSVNHPYQTLKINRLPFLMKYFK